MLAALLAVLAAWPVSTASAAPTIGTSPGVSSYTERSAAYTTYVDPNLIISSTRPIVSATVIITEPFEMTVDEIASQVFNGLNRPFPYNTTTRTYTLQGTATAAEYQAVLRTTTFLNPSSTPRIEQRAITFTVTDDQGAQASATKRLNIVLVNNAPEVALSATSATYTEGTGKKVLDSSISANDADSFDLQSATIQITANFDSTKDFLAFGEDVTKVKSEDGITLLGLTSTWSNTTGTLTLSGVARRQVYTELLRGITYENAQKDITTGTRTIAWTLTDVEGLTGPSKTMSLAVQSVNQLPVLTMGTYTTAATYGEGDTAIVLDNQITLSDADHTTLASATVAVTTGFESGKDTLLVGAGSTVTSSYAAATGVLTLTGGATLADYQAALRLVSYSNTAEDASTGKRVMTFTVTDGAGGTATGTREVQFSTVLDGTTLTGTVSSLTSVAKSALVQSTLVVTDPDSAMVSKATITIATGCASGDVLTVSDMHPEIVASFSGCVLTLNGDSSKANYQAKMRTIRITVTSGDIERMVSFVATDPTGKSGNTLSRSFYFTALTKLPTVTSATSVPTSGGTVTITGTKFGPTSPNLVTRVVIGSIECTNIVVTVAETKLECTLGEGAGSSLTVEVTVSDRRGPVAAVFAYTKPSITSTTSVDTAGGTVTITGTSFGVVGNTNLLASAGGSVIVASQVCANPTVTVAHTKIECTAASGTGKNLPVEVSVRGVTSTDGGTKFSYNAPTITALFRASAFGYTAIITGTNYGPTTTASNLITITATPQGGGTTITCSNPSVTTANTVIQCTMPAATLTTAADVNKLFDVTLTVNGQSNTDGTGKFQFEGPVITATTSPNLFGGIVTITGRNFGPLRSGTSTNIVLLVGTDAPAKQVDATINASAAVTSVPGMVARYGAGLVTTFCSTRKCMPEVTVVDTEMQLYIDDYTQMQAAATITPQLVLQVQVSNSINLQSAAYTTFTYEGPVITGQLEGSQFGEPGNPAAPLLGFVGRNLGSDINFGTARAWSTTTSLEWFKIDGIQVTDNTGTITSATTAQISKTPARHPTPKTGAGLPVTLKINGIEKTSTNIFSYGGPIINTVAGQGVMYAGSGTQVMTIAGYRFGPRFSDMDGVRSLNYFDTTIGYPNAKVEVCTTYSCGTKVQCTTPQVFTADVEIRCNLPEGIYIETSVYITIYDGVRTSLNTGANKLSVSSPTVTAIQKTGGGLPATTGSNVQISGYSFGPVTPTGGTAPISVMIGNPPGVACTNVKITTSPPQPNGPSTLTCDAPVGSGVNNPIALTLTNDGRTLTNAAQGTAANIFTYSGPVITAVTPAATQGGPFNITGNGFGPATTTGVSGLANAIALTNIQVVSDTLITASMPTAGIGGPYPITVTVNGQQSASVNLFHYADPVVSSISVAPSVFGGTFTITGQNFGAPGTTAVVQITYGGVTETATGPTVASHTSIVATVTCPTLCHTSARDVLVTISGKTSGTSGNGKLSYAGPVVTSVADISMFASDTNVDPLTITGTNLGSATLAPVVQICAKADLTTCFTADFTTATGVTAVVPTGSTTATSVTAQIPPGLGENLSVKVTLTQGTVTVDSGTTGQNSFKYVTPTYTTVTDTTTSPAVARVPNQLPTSGGVLSITGSRLGPLGGTKVTRVVWNNGILTTANPTITTLNNELQITIPAGVRFIPFSVHMSYNSLQSTAVASPVLYFKYASPTITSATSIATAGGRTTITGTNFGPDTANLQLVEIRNTTGVYHTGTNCAITSHTTIECDVGAGIGTGHTIRVQIAGESATSGTVFNYIAPAITSVSVPTTGPQPNWTYTGHDGTQNAWITVTGTNFGPVGNIAGSVTFGGAICLFPRVITAHTTMQCLLGEGSGKDHDVSFAIGGQNTLTTNPVNGQLQGSGLNAFRYASPAVVSHNKVSFFGGATITIQGSDFGCGPGATGSSTGGLCKLPLNGATQTISVSIGGSACTSPVVSTPHTHIKCTAPARLDNAVITNLASSVTVGGQTATFNYDYAVPIISNVSEASFFGGQITITGQFFGPVGPFTGTTYFLSYSGSTVYPPATGRRLMAADGGRRSLLNTYVYPTPQVTIADTQIVFEVPAPVSSSVGLNVDLTIRGVSAGTTGHGLLNFVGPRIESVSSPPTSGGLITIKGRNFGPAGSASLNQARIDSLPCSGHTVSVAGSEITCTVGPGTGKNLNAFIRINTETDAGTGTGKFSYAPPSVLQIVPMNQLPGENITIKGNSFGDELSLISISIGGTPCSYVGLVTPHTELICTTPQILGANKSLSIVVNGVQNVNDVFSYTAPEVHNVTHLPASGGVATIKGAVFGPVNGSQVTLVKLGNSTCTYPNITDVNTIKCHASPMHLAKYGGTYADVDLAGDGLMDVVVYIDNQPSGATGKDKFGFLEPVVTALSAQLAGGGERLTITGREFGMVHQGIVASMVSTWRGVTRTHISPLTTNVGSPDGAGFQNFEFEMPQCTGGVDNLLNLTINGRPAAFSISLAARNVAFRPPAIQGITGATSPHTSPPTTDGGMVVIAGANFGPLGEGLNGSPWIESFKIFSPVTGISYPCANANVTTHGTRVTCYVGPGAGQSLDVIARVSGQESGKTGVGTFAYPKPTVTAVFPDLTGPGQDVFISGTNFGPDSNGLSIAFQGPGDDTCGPIRCITSTMLIPHQQVKCQAAINVGTNLDVFVNATNQVNDPAPAAKFSYESMTIKSISRSTTEGSDITIVGTGFGPITGSCYQSYFQSITLSTQRGIVCTDARVTLPNQIIVCRAGEGTGKLHSASLNMRGTLSASTGLNAFSYQPPNVTSVVPLATRGGTMQILGTNFGASGTSAELLSVVIYKPEPVNCTNARIGTNAHRELLCDFVEGSGGGYDVVVTVDGQTSGDTGLKKFAYARPVVESITPAVQPKGETTTQLTIVGRNFGQDVSKLNVTVGNHPVDLTSIRLIITERQGAALATEEIRVTAPFAAGQNLPVIVTCDGLKNDMENSPNAKFSYSAPFITEVEPVETQGGPTIVRGGNLGPLGPVHKVLLDNRTCANPIVIKENTEIQCEAPRGYGANLNAFVQITEFTGTGSADTGNGKFRYRCPQIVRLVADKGRASEGKTGQMMTLIGRSFGHNTSAMTLTVGRDSWTTPGEAIVFPFPDLVPDSAGQYRIRAPVPVGFGSDMNVTIDVAGQDNMFKCASATEGNLAEAQKFSYSPPIIRSSTSASTAGGEVTVTGENFGPLCGGGGAQEDCDGQIGPIVVYGWQGGSTVHTCTGGKVIASNVRIACNLTAGEGKNLDMELSIGGMSSGRTTSDAARYSYSLPQVYGITPNVVETGTRVTVTGENFGVVGSQVRVTVTRALPSGREAYLSVDGVEFLDNHTRFAFDMPLGSGTGLALQIELPVLVESSNPTLFAQASPDREDRPLFSFAPPTIISATPVSTSGGRTTITGKGFGVAGATGKNAVTSVSIAGLPAYGVNVTKAGTQIECDVAPGVGKDQRISVAVNFQESVGGDTAFRYATPAVLDVLPASALPGTVVTVRGVNFGSSNDLGVVKVFFGDYESKAVSVKVSHFEITCEVPQGKGIAVPVVVQVAEQPSPATSAKPFTFVFSGCTDAAAANFDQFATVDDNTCRILGCTRSLSPNFNVKANEDDGSCIKDPANFTMTLRLDYQKEYLINREKYDRLVAQEIGQALKIESARVSVVAHRSGSTVLDLQIADLPNSTAADALNRLEQLVLTSRFDFSFATLLKINVPEQAGVEKRDIMTKAAEPPVSEASIIALCVGVFVVFVFAIFWKRIMVTCVKVCCGGAPEEDIRMDVVGYQQAGAPYNYNQAAGGYYQTSGRVAPGDPLLGGAPAPAGPEQLRLESAEAVAARK